MKKLIYYAGIMIVIVVLLPMFIVRGCAPSAPSPSPSPSSSPYPYPSPSPLPQKEAVTAEKVKITVYNASQNKSQEMDLEEYIMGVVAAEMPADFSLEALKAQAVAARTFAYGRMTGVYSSKQGMHDGTDICTESTHCQAWIGKEAALKKWSLLFASRNWGKIERAVNDTKGLIVVYQGNIANTLFHASSSGKTENVEEVWTGSPVPYLQSVDSSGDEASKGYVTPKLFTTEQIVQELRKKYPQEEFDEDIAENMEILNYTTGGRVKTLKIGNITMKGTEFRTLLGLRSASFVIEQAGDGKVKITTTGHGHGVGMSQWGADSLAKRGGTYREILEHYYTGVDVISIQRYEELTGSK